HLVLNNTMSSRTPVHSDKAPVPRPVYSQAITVNGLVFCSGQIGKDRATGQFVEGTVKDRTVSVFHRQTIKNLGYVLTEAGSSLNDVVEVDVFLTSQADFDPMNESYAEFFGDIKPARTLV
ncbi:hypothetical protein KAF25_010482, partial [Fusarium avenaceum]